MKNIKKNYIYNIFYQVLLIIIPFITAPYLSRVIGATGSGIYSYTYSIAYYFMLIAMLGINNYGNRAIAKSRDNKEKLSRTFLEIYSIQLVMTIIMLILFGIFVALTNYQYKSILMLQILCIISVVFDINWFFQGMEQFKIIVTRNSIVKIATLTAIFLFVKNSDDLWKYTAIMAIGTLLGQIVSWGFLKKYITFQKIKWNNIKKHIPKIIILFIPTIAISIYQIMDKIMLGSISNMNEVGFYEYSEKIVSIPISIIASLGAVMLPHMSNLISKGKVKECKEYVGYSLKFQLFVALPMALGIIAVSPEFIPIYLGEDFGRCILITCCLACMVPFVAWQTVLRTQYLLPMNKDKDYVVSTFVGAITNFVANSILIPQYGGAGAAVGTVIAEFSVMAYITFRLRKELDLAIYLKNVLPIFGKALIMFVVVYSIGFLPFTSIVKMLLQILIGVVLYICMNIQYIKAATNYDLYIKKLKKKLVH